MCGDLFALPQFEDLTVSDDCGLPSPFSTGGGPAGPRFPEATIDVAKVANANHTWVAKLIRH